jgi:hypothetical protein
MLLMQRRLIACAMFAAAVGFLAPSRAGAVPIGTFSWDDTCGTVFLDPCFSVSNLTGIPDLTLPTPVTFTDVMIHLVSDVGPMTFGLGDILSFGQSVLFLPNTITAATLTFGFELPGTIQLLDGETGTPITNLFDLAAAVVPTFADPEILAIGGVEFAQVRTATIDFTQSASVPEPGTLMLLTGGLAMLAATHRRRSRSRPT